MALTHIPTNTNAFKRMNKRLKYFTKRWLWSKWDSLTSYHLAMTASSSKQRFVASHLVFSTFNTSTLVCMAGQPHFHQDCSDFLYVECKFQVPWAVTERSADIHLKRLMSWLSINTEELNGLFWWQQSKGYG